MKASSRNASTSRQNLPARLPTKTRGRHSVGKMAATEARDPMTQEPIDWAIFEGWDRPITCDTDRYGQRSVSIMRGNACYNFMGTPEQVRAWIEAGQLNPFFETYKALAIEGQLETVVFPEHVITGNHAVIDRLMTDNPEVTV